MRSALLDALGGEAGCRQLAADFYARVGKDPVLRPLFPGKSLRCAIEEFSAFLVQFLEGAEEHTQYRWWLSLRESHARFRIGAAERAAWLKHMTAALDAAALDDATRKALRDFFGISSAYVVGGASPAEPRHQELAGRWNAQLTLDDAIAAIAAGHDQQALELAPRFAHRPSVFTGLLARMVQAGRAPLISFVMDSANQQPSLGAHRFGGRTLLHFAAGAGCLPVVELLLGAGIDANTQDRGGHTPLYSVANECGSDAGPVVVRALVKAGADVNARGGVTQATALHMAARRGHADIAQALLECGARPDLRDKKGDTPLQRAINCRRDAVAKLLRPAANRRPTA